MSKNGLVKAGIQEAVTNADDDILAQDPHPFSI